MSDNVFQLASVTLTKANGEVVDLGKGACWLNIGEPAPEESTLAQNTKLFQERVVGQTFTISGTFEMSATGYAILVGLTLPYRLRQFHQNLGRYTRWPYTN